MANTDPSKRINWQISLLGGHEQRVGGRADDTAVVTSIGGADIDLTGAELAPETTLTKVSLIGGVKLRVPADTHVEIEGFHLFGGRRVEAGTPSPSAPVVRVRAYGIIGGVRVSRL
ncbi:LiaF domain-containing protein [Micromonospora sp. NPDC023737]|uniref:LiaF domain-containing protein n=1 Tax=unclassified Micromonospora TaxID=2617518 RepID=UPI0033EF718F